MHYCHQMALLMYHHNTQARNLQCCCVMLMTLLESLIHTSQVTLSQFEFACCLMTPCHIQRPATFLHRTLSQVEYFFSYFEHLNIFEDLKLDLIWELNLLPGFDL